MKTLNYLLIVIVLLFFIQCNDDNLESVIDETVSSQGVRGNIQKGPFISGSSVIVQELDSQFTSNGTAFNTSTNDDFGGFELTSIITSPFIEIITSGFYFNEVSGGLSEANITLRSLTAISDSTSTNVNLLTTLSRDRIIYLVLEEGLEYNNAKRQAQNEILSIFNIPESNFLNFNQLDITLDGDENAILLAVSSVLQGELSVANLSELVSKLTLDIESDGLLDDNNLKEKLLSNAKKLDLKSVRTNLNNRYIDLNYNATIPEFEKYAKRLTPLEILKTSPEINEAEVPFNLDSINIYLNKPINPESINTGNIIIANSSNEIVTGNFQYDDNEYKIIFIPSQELLPEEEYTVVLTDGIVGIDDDPLVSGFEFGFKSLQVNTDNGLLAYYPFSHSSNDESGNLFHATAVNTTFTNDIKGNNNQACKINGEGSYLELPNILNMTKLEWSYSIWFRLEDLKSGTVAMLLGSRLSGASFWDLPLYIRSSSRTVNSYNETLMELPEKINLNQWYHLTLTIDHGTAKMYLNGELKAEKDNFFSAQDNTGYTDFLGDAHGSYEFYTGKYYISEKYRNDSFPTYIEGTVDNIRFYERAINKYEVARLYTDQN